ncbi:putative DNA ligase [Yellowstone lake phycodnavirus 3]|uniref:putative DNA ligase n=1 Tax=Yellowstone lake phycodnavirus 3 TaxID=1586715 RepID=UPI0006EB9F47|nr:putative DNA ligase [Yellowstone lake phycodnavirus 3]BAT22721.1 putative DNA ligase [Yellowstone lake phycodnavirus 3]
MNHPSINVAKLFQVPRRPWPVVNRGNAINRVQKILKSNHVTGIPSHWPKMYYGQTRANLNLNRTYRNTNTATLPDGVYLYLIEYNPSTNRYHKSFVRVHNLLESGSRHFQLPTRNQGRIIVAAGELSKEGRTVKFNLESGTYTRNLMKLTGNYVTESNYIRLVKNALRNSIPSKNYTTNILIPKIPASLQNLVNRGNLSFYHGIPTNKTRARVLKELAAAGINSNSATNLVRKLKNSSPARATPAGPKRKANKNGNAAGAPQVHRRSGRSARRV